MEAQQEKTAFKMFFRQGEMTALLKSCIAGLDQAIDVFMVNSALGSACEWINRIITGQWCRSGQGYQYNEGLSRAGPPKCA
jgi:hypothetical protein